MEASSKTMSLKFWENLIIYKADVSTAENKTREEWRAEELENLHKSKNLALIK